jgi:replicative DNA helicase
MTIRVMRYEEILAQYEKDRSDPLWSPVRLGFGTIDTEIRGVVPGQVLVIAARSAVGKTWMLNALEHNFSANTTAGQVSLSLEMPAVEWAERALAIHENVSTDLVSKWARDRELPQHCASFLGRMRRSLVVENAVRIVDLAAVVTAAQEMLDVPVRLVTIDYQGLLLGGGTSAYERASATALAVKMFAKSQNVAVVTAMQINRQGGDGGVPVTLDMLRDSGVTEESCDFLLGCWRPALGVNDEQRRSWTEEELEEQDAVLAVKILKNRKGKQGRRVDLRFHAESRRLYEPADPFRV